MTIIVNLSSLHRLLPLSTGLDAFTRLCKYSHGCFSCCPSIFTQMTNKAWVSWKYYENLQTVINPYKLGGLTTDQFLERMLNIFYFLGEENIKFSREEIADILKNKRHYISLKHVDDTNELNHRLIAFSLLEKAWNAIIDLEDSDLIKFDFLIGKNEPVYLISNTNELNINKLLNLLREHFSGIRWKEQVDLSSKKDDVPVEIAPNIYLCLSYRFGAYKTEEDNKEAQNSTPCLLGKLVASLKCDKSQIKVVSQYSKDLEEAIRLDIPANNIYVAKDYFPTPAKTLRQVI